MSLWLNMFNWLLFNHIQFLTILVHQEQHHYQKHWELIHHSINWTWIEFIIESVKLIFIQYHYTSNKIRDSGITSLSEALKVNSSLNQLQLILSLLLNMIIWLLFNHITFLPILENQEQHHYQKHWELIHHSLNCIWEWVYWMWSIDYYWNCTSFITRLDAQGEKHWPMFWKQTFQSQVLSFEPR